MRNLFWLTAVLLLSACATPLKVHNDSQANADWLTQKQQRYQLHSWLLKGRVAVQTEDNGGQADLIWQQSDGDFSIQLNAPLGAGALELTSLSWGVLLSSSNGEQLFADSAEALIQQIQGWQFPVSGLRYWLLGVPVPGEDYKLISWLDNQQLHVLNQDGWHIEFRQYQKVNDMWLPRKIFMHRLDNSEVDVRLIIRQWVLDNA